MRISDAFGNSVTLLSLLVAVCASADDTGPAGYLPPDVDPAKLNNHDPRSEPHDDFRIKVELPPLISRMAADLAKKYPRGPFDYPLARPVIEIVRVGQHEDVMWDHIHAMNEEVSHLIVDMMKGKNLAEAETLRANFCVPHFPPPANREFFLWLKLDKKSQSKTLVACDLCIAKDKENCGEAFNCWRAKQEPAAPSGWSSAWEYNQKGGVWCVYMGFQPGESPYGRPPKSPMSTDELKKRHLLPSYPPTKNDTPYR